MRALFGGEKQDARQQSAQCFFPGKGFGAIVVRLVQQVQAGDGKQAVDPGGPEFAPERSAVSLPAPIGIPQKRNFVCDSDATVLFPAPERPKKMCARPSRTTVAPCKRTPRCGRSTIVSNMRSKESSAYSWRTP